MWILAPKTHLFVQPFFHSPTLNLVACCAFSTLHLLGGFPNDIKPVNIKLKSLTKHKNDISYRTDRMFFMAEIYMHTIPHLNYNIVSGCFYEQQFATIGRR